MPGALFLIYVLVTGDIKIEELPAETCRRTVEVWERFPDGHTVVDDDFVKVSGVACLEAPAAVRLMMFAGTARGL